MKLLTFIAIVVLTATTAFGQNNSHWCATDLKLDKQLSASPKLKDQLHLSRVRSTRKTLGGQQKMAAYVIPVVVHIIHDNGVGNISDAQIESALSVLNIDYNRMNADTTATRNSIDAPFKQNAAGMDVEFKLAKIDPQGNCTNGIVRVNAPHLTHDADDDCKYSVNGGSDGWPADQYFNIWVVNNIDSDGAAGIIAGYAYYPNFGPSDFYGILMDNSYFGTIETAEYEDGRVLTHEMGHALGLPHIFSGGCHTGDCFSEGDYSCDTPPQEEANWSCGPTWNSCNNVPTNDTYGFDTYDQIENYMSYNYCQNMFSNDQVTIMQNNCDDIPFLSNMTSPANLIATGVNDPEILCAASFDSYKRVLCTGSVADFVDFSHTNPTSWTWTVSPGVEGLDFNFVNSTTSTSQQPSIEFLTSGQYTISLLASDGVNSDLETKVDFIHVLPQNGGLPFHEGFEFYNSLSSTDNWLVENFEDNAEFEIANGISHSGSKSAVLQNFNESGSNSDELISSQVDLSGVDPATQNITLSFRYSYRKRFMNTDEWLKVFVSNDCAETWYQRRTIHGDALSSIVYTNPWVPQNENDWTTVHMTNVSSSFFVSNFRYKFEFEGDSGNNFYLDDINIYLGAPSDDVISTLAEQSELTELSVYPNPVNEELSVEFSVNASNTTEIEIRDIAGKISQEYTIYANEGHNKVFMNTSNLASGVYFLQITLSGLQRTVQFVVE